MLDSENGIGYNKSTIFFGVARYVSNSRIVNAKNKQGHDHMQWQTWGLDGLRTGKGLFPWTHVIHRERGAWPSRVRLNSAIARSWRVQRWRWIISRASCFGSSHLLCPVANRSAPQHCPSLRSVKLNRLKRKSLRNACKQISGHQHDQLSIFHLFAGNMTSAVKTYPSPAFLQESSSVPPHFSNVFRTLFKPRPWCSLSGLVVIMSADTSTYPLHGLLILMK